ncbi:replication initiator protein A [Rossellomorea yichunensis]|uniref:replication initiator protein A n=1 Tax=Rossellomorea yichunensis TaxID=3077331 RepID=UPI0028DDB306|nr:replication initiator protein A [Rossellomorea sp. YC4-1]MDT9027880.1 replication initiator protein A [Rossellomorea sp. YC4-1]
MEANESTWFLRLTMDLFRDKDLKGLKNDGILLYAYMQNRIELTSFVDENGEKYIIVTEKSADKFLRIKRVKFYALKKQLRDLGLIRYDEQEVKRGGNSTPIYVVPYEHWKIQKKSCSNN